MFGLSFPGLSTLKSLATKALVYAGVAAACTAGGAFLGWRYEHNAWQADIGQKLAAVSKANARSAILQGELDAAKQQHALTYLVLKTEVLPNVDLIVTSPGEAPKPRPKYYLTHFDLCLWNNGLLAAGSPAGSVDANPCANPPDYLATSVDVQGLFGNALQNFQQYADCRSVVKSWQDWYLGLPASLKR